MPKDVSSPVSDACILLCVNTEYKVVFDVMDRHGIGLIKILTWNTLQVEIMITIDIDIFCGFSDIFFISNVEMLTSCLCMQAYRYYCQLNEEKHICTFIISI